MKLFQMVFENEYNDLSDEELILLNRANTLSGIPYFALQKVLSKRGLTTYRIIEIEQNSFNKDNKWLNVKEKYKKMLLHLGKVTAKDDRGTHYFCSDEGRRRFDTADAKSKKGF